MFTAFADKLRFIPQYGGVPMGSRPIHHFAN
jgi:hypothetical protein